MRNSASSHLSHEQSRLSVLLIFRVGLTAAAALASVAPSIAFAVDVPQSFTLDGRLFSDTAATVPLQDGAIGFTVQILDEAKLCILYEEKQVVNTLFSKGYFSAQVGTDIGNALRTSGDSANSMAAVFQNMLPINGKLLSDGSPCTVPAVGGKRRYVRIQISPPTMGGAPRILAPDLTIDSVPNAVIAERAESLQGLRSTDFLKVNTVSGSALSQANLESIFTSTTRFNSLSSVIDGTSTSYMRSNSLSGAQLPVLSGAPLSPGPGSVWYDSTDSSLKFQSFGGPLTLSTAGASASAWTVAGSDVYRATGNVGIGTTAPVSKLDVNGSVRIGTDVATCSPTNKGSIRYNNVTNVLEFCNGSSWNLVQAAACTDATPNSFVFTDQSNQTASTVITSDIQLITGFNCNVPVTISGAGMPQIQICSDAACSTLIQGWTSGPTSIVNGQYMQLRQTTDIASGAMTQATVIAGGTASIWSVSTTGGDCISTTPPAGTVCADGTIYAGLSPDGGVKMFTTRCDYGQNWNGSACMGTRLLQNWNNGTFNFPNTGYTNNNTGKINSAGLFASSDSGSPYAAATICENLNQNGQIDWYLPALNELNILYANKAVIRNFDTSGIFYHSSSDVPGNQSSGTQRFSDGYQSVSQGKATPLNIRCVRR